MTHVQIGVLSGDNSNESGCKPDLFSMRCRVGMVEQNKRRSNRVGGGTEALCINLGLFIHWLFSFADSARCRQFA